MAIPVFWLKQSKCCFQKVQFLLCESSNIHDTGVLWSKGYGEFQHHSEKTALNTILLTTSSYQQKQLVFALSSRIAVFMRFFIFFKISK